MVMAVTTAADITVIIRAVTIVIPSRSSTKCNPHQRVMEREKKTKTSVYISFFKIGEYYPYLLT